MKKILLLLSFTILAMASVQAQEMISVESDLQVDEAVDKIREAIEAKELKLFSVIDHQAAAEEAGMKLEGLQVIVFGNPELGSQLMQVNPRVGIELPMKILVFMERDRTTIAYHDPMLLLETYKLDEKKHLLEKMQKVMLMLARAGVE